MTPSVCCVMLTANREALTRRAIENWKRQTYENKFLIVFDTGREFADLDAAIAGDKRIVLARSSECKDLNVGDLRNVANEGIQSDLIAHFDSDDWSAPGRLASQVGAIELIERDVVGYRSLVYFSTLRSTAGAWLYSHPSPTFVLGGSMLYSRNTWRAKPFPSVENGEDTRWIRGLRTCSAEGVADGWPRMIARIHGANTSDGIIPGLNTGDQDNAGRFRRVPELDEKCSFVLEA